MKKITWITAAAALLAAAWAVTVLPSGNSQESLPPFAGPYSPKALTVVQTPSKSFALYQQCRQLIDHNFSRLETVQQIAQECHSNAGDLCRVFERYAHQRPDQYLLHLKKLHAAALRHQAA
jgi:AraC-like DNA-binding protein